MEGRPKIIIELTSSDKILEATCFILLIILWMGTIAGFSYLPEKIPSHFNAVGQPDDYSDRLNIFTLPIVASILYIGMTIINKYPHLYNYPSNINAENARQLYKSATKLIRILKLVVIVIFSLIVFMTYSTSLNITDGLGVWFLPLSFGLMFLPVVYYLFKSSSTKPISR